MARRLGLTPWDFDAAARDPEKAPHLIREELVMEYEAAVDAARR